MALLDRVRVALTGFPGGPGVSTFYFGRSDTKPLTALQTMYQQFLNAMPISVHAVIATDGDIIEDTTGVITGAWTQGGTSGMNGAATGAYAAPSGAIVRWTTGTILDGKRVRGRSFFVPLGGGAYDSSGTILDGVLASFQSAVNTYMATSPFDMRIWHRPRKARAADATHLAVTARDGGNGVVLGGIVPDKVSILRSRRD